MITFTPPYGQFEFYLHDLFPSSGGGAFLRIENEFGSPVVIDIKSCHACGSAVSNCADHLEWHNRLLEIHRTTRNENDFIKAEIELLRDEIGRIQAW